MPCLLFKIPTYFHHAKPEIYRFSPSLTDVGSSHVQTTSSAGFSHSLLQARPSPMRLDVVRRWFVPKLHRLNDVAADVESDASNPPDAQILKVLRKRLCTKNREIFRSNFMDTSWICLLFMLYVVYSSRGRRHIWSFGIKTSLNMERFGHILSKITFRLSCFHYTRDTTPNLERLPVGSQA